MIEKSAKKNIDKFLELTQEDMVRVDTLIDQQLHTDIDLISKVTNYIIQSGGKRLRPALVLLSANALGQPSHDQHITLATIIEFIHTATLLHDDVVDDSTQRRGQDAAHTVWSNSTSILVGDFLYSRAFQMIVAVKNLTAMSVLADTTNIIAEGEVLQLTQCHNPNTSEASYMDVIQRKTAQLFAAACELGAVTQDATPTQRQNMAQYGLTLGIAFQLIDDALDFSASSAQLGKNIGDDLAEGKPTLPLIYALQHGTPTQANMIKTAIKTGGLDQLEPIIEAIHETQALAYVTNLAKTYATQAQASLTSLPESPYKTALMELPQNIIHRKN